MRLRVYASMALALLASACAWAQDDLEAFRSLKPYFVGDTQTVTVPHTTCTLLVGAVVDSVSYNGTWRADESALCRELIEEAARQQRSVLFNLRFVGDEVNMGMVAHLARTIVDAHRSATIDTAITRCFIHTEIPLLRIDPPEADDAGVKARVHLNADGSILLDGSAAKLIGLGSTLEERQVTVVYISADETATVGALRDLLQELAAHRIKGVMATAP